MNLEQMKAWHAAKQAVPSPPPKKEEVKEAEVVTDAESDYAQLEEMADLLEEAMDTLSMYGRKRVQVGTIAKVTMRNLSQKIYEFLDDNCLLIPDEEPDDTNTKS